MRKLLLLIILFCLCIQVQAQKKNEVQIGVPAAYFFDDTPYMFHNLKRAGLFPTHVNYSRLFTDKNGLSFSYDNLWLFYGFPSVPGTTKLELRAYNKLSVEFYRQKRIGRFSIRGSLGLGYRFYGGELFWTNFVIESHSHNNPYNHIGVTTGVQAKLQLYRNLSAVAKLNYSRYFAEYTPNELHNVFALSYEF